MRTTSDIITDSEIETVHAYANFGEQNKRDVVDEGVLMYAFGYATGHTQMTILQEHGLLRASKPMTSRVDLSAKGKEYLRAMFSDSSVRKILDHRTPPKDYRM